MIDFDEDWDEDEDQDYMENEFMNMDKGFSRSEIWEIIEQMDRKDFLWLKNKINSK